jgi:hypothetical protein
VDDRAAPVRTTHAEPERKLRRRPGAVGEAACATACLRIGLESAALRVCWWSRRVHSKAQCARIWVLRHQRVPRHRPQLCGSGRRGGAAVVAGGGPAAVRGEHSCAELGASRRLVLEAVAAGASGVQRKYGPVRRTLPLLHCSAAALV